MKKEQSQVPKIDWRKKVPESFVKHVQETAEKNAKTNWDRLCVYVIGFFNNPFHPGTIDKKEILKRLADVIISGKASSETVPNSMLEGEIEYIVSTIINSTNVKEK